MAWHPLQQSRHSLRHPSQVYRNINFSKARGWKIRGTNIVWRWELIPCLRLNRSAIFPQVPQEEFSLRNMYERRTRCFMLQEKWTRDALIWKKCKFPCRSFMNALHSYQRWKYFWIPCRDPTECPRPPLHVKKRPNMPLTTRKPRGVHCFKYWRCLTIF